MLSRANYQEQDILRLARRRDTSKRAYLLVNPLQAKHVPSRPGEALAMMEALGRALAARRIWLLYHSPSNLSTLPEPA